jgi:hypothetical protein
MARSRPWLRIALSVCLGLLVCALVSAPVLMVEDEDLLPPEGPYEPPEKPPEEWEDNPYEDYAPTEGYEIEVPGIFGISTIAIGEVLDCETGEPIPYQLVTLRVVYRDGATHPYAVEDIEGIIVSGPGYAPRIITELEPMEFGVLFLTITVLVPLESPICLSPWAPHSITPTHPIAACVGEVTVSVASEIIPFEWTSTGSFDSFEIFIYENPCGQYPPGPTPTPTPTPVPPDTPTTPTPGPTTPTPTPSPGPTPSSGQPVTTTAGVWEPLWDKLCPEQREEMTRRHLEEGLSGWAWVKAAREMLEGKGESVPAAGYLVEQEDVLLPDTPLITEVGPIEPSTRSVEIDMSELLEPGEAFTWQIMGVYEDDAGETAAMLSDPQCLRYEPVTDLGGDVTPVVSCPECVPVKEQWECETPIKVDRSLDYYPKKSTMNPDERIAISVHANDADLLYWKCECFEETLRKIGSYADRVTYEWQLVGEGDLVDPYENSVMYQFPLDVAPGETEKATVRCKIRAPRGGDKEIEGRIEIEITGGEEACDDYTVDVTVTPVKEEPCPPPPDEKGRDCLAVLKYGKADGPISGTIMVYNMAYRNEPIILKATHVDTDELTIKCERTVCLERPEFDYPLPDPLTFTWSDQGAGGTFPLGNIGRGVVYIPPPRDEVTIKCDVKDLVVRDRDVKEQKAQPIAQVVIDLTKCEYDWLPEKDNTTPFTARIYQYRNGQCTYPGPSRRISFDLVDASSEEGFCVNGGSAFDVENDLFFDKARLQAGFHLCNDETLLAAQPKYYAQATTKTRAAEATVTVSSEDYGSHGEIKATAFNAQPIEPRDPTGAVVCRLGDNTVDIPLDDFPQGGNFIADKWDAKYPTHLVDTDDQDRSLNNANHGDGLSRYEEYRGVDVNNDGRVTYNHARTDPQELRNPSNERLSPNLKDLFVQSTGFGGNYPFAIGDAFRETEILLHTFGGTIGLDDRGIDVLEVRLDPGVSQARNDDGLISYNGQAGVVGNNPNTAVTGVWIRNWTFDTLGESGVGNAVDYSAVPAFATRVYRSSLDHYFDDETHDDGDSLIGLLGLWAAPPNGVLDWRDNIEDANDNGRLDANERNGTSGANDPGDDGDGDLDGDHLFLDASNHYAVNRDLGPFDHDGDDLVWTSAFFEDPAAAGVPAEVRNEYAKNIVIRHLITHEIGHGVGIGPHCNDATCVMYQWTMGWHRDGHFCNVCRGRILIHNN